MPAKTCEHLVRKDGCKFCAKKCEHGAVKKNCKQCRSCEHGERRSRCVKCLSPDQRCPHEGHPVACRECAYERKGKREREAVTTAEIEYYYEREFARTVMYLSNHPEALQRMKMDLIAQGVRGLRVEDVTHQDQVVGQEVVFDPDS